MVKPKGTIGSTKMKIIAVIHHNCSNNMDTHGYTIWQTLKTSFYVYLDDNDVRNVYHHLKGLCKLGYLEKRDPDTRVRCCYNITEKGMLLAGRYEPYLRVLDRMSL